MTHDQQTHKWLLNLLTGTDSRIGFGYRLGDHADIQVQFEIGPQKETKAIGVSSNKRSVKPDDEMNAKNKVVKVTHISIQF